MFPIEDIKNCSVMMNQSIYLHVGYEGIPSPHQNPIPIVFEYNKGIYYLIYDLDASRVGEFVCFHQGERIIDLPSREELFLFVRNLVEKFNITVEMYEEVYEIMVPRLHNDMFGDFDDDQIEE